MLKFPTYYEVETNGREFEIIAPNGQLCSVYNIRSQAERVCERLNENLEKFRQLAKPVKTKSMIEAGLKCTGDNGQAIFGFAQPQTAHSAIDRQCPVSRLASVQAWEA